MDEVVAYLIWRLWLITSREAAAWAELHGLCFIGRFENQDVAVGRGVDAIGAGGALILVVFDAEGVSGFPVNGSGPAGGDPIRASNREN